MKDFLNKVFKLEENKTTIRTEVVAGITTFFAMCYIIIVNPNQMTGFAQGPMWNACFVGGILAAVIATLVMAFVANKPFALAAGMGLNSFFFVSFILPTLTTGVALKDAYGAGLAIILISGLVFLLLSVTGARKYIAQSLPACIKVAMSAGIGLFIAFIGFQNANVVVDNQYTLVQFANFTKWVIVADGSLVGGAATAVVALVGFILIVVFAQSKVKVLNRSSIVLGVVAATVLYYVFSIFTPELRVSLNTMSVGQVFKDWAEYGFFNFNFKAAFDGKLLGSVFSAIMLVITYCLVDMFDTIGTLYGTSAEAGLVDENGDPVNVQEEMLADSVGTVVGAVTGSSTITTFVESASGVAAGGRTGLTALTTAVLFLVCLFAAPLVAYVPSCATAPALIYVGLLMLKNITKVDFSNATSAATAFITVIMMVCTYSISNGIMLGAMTYVLLQLLTGKYTKKDIVVTGIAVLGLLKFILVVM